MSTGSQVVERNSEKLPSEEEKVYSVNVILVRVQIIHTGAALNKGIVSGVLLFADMFGFRVLNIVLSIRVNH